MRFVVYWWKTCWLAVLVVLAVPSVSLPAAPFEHREFKPGTFETIESLPLSRFRTQLENLPENSRSRALLWLRTLHFTTGDLPALHVDQEGGVYYADQFTLEPGADPQPMEPEVQAAAVPVSPFPASLVFHSRPGAPNVLFINFSGENITGTAWNSSLGRTLIPAVAFSTDSDFSTFSDSEQSVIRRVWQRVAEDYAPFDIDVTTERPATFTSRTAHALVTRNTDANGEANPSSSSGGVAYSGVFGSFSYATYRPAFIYYNNVGGNESYIGEAVSHEIGHNMGLSHDGRTDGTEYYAGHGSGEISWAPIMGASYGRNVTQWSKGEYYQANNTQDDLAIIAGKLSYRVDDVGNTLGTATALSILGGTNIQSTTPETDPQNQDPANKGVIERNTDADFFSFITGDGPVDISINPWVMSSTTSRGGNLDLLVELQDSTGSVVLSTNPPTATGARLTMSLADGLYFLKIRSTGAGTPTNSIPTGYTGYGSLGQYFIKGTLVASTRVIPPRAETVVSDIKIPGTGPKEVAVTYSDNAAIEISSLDGQDIRVTGPLGYEQAARFLRVDNTANGSPRTATYAIDPPADGVWLPVDSGVYTLWMQTNQVSDTEGAFVAAGKLAEFTVDVPTAVYAASMDTDPGWTLEPLWAYGVPAYVGGGPTAGASGERIIAYNLSGQYENFLSEKHATTPVINCVGKSGLTLRFHRWLRLRSGDYAAIRMSIDGSTWTEIWSSTKTVADDNWVEVQYPLPASADGSPNLRLRWVISSGPAQRDIGWNIDDVLLLAGGSLDVTPPSAALSVASITQPGAPEHSFTVTYTDDAAVRVASLGDADLVVTGPNNYSNVVVFTGRDVETDGTPRTASYSVAAPGEAWAATDNGIYEITLLEDAVSDVNNNTMPGASLGTFTVAIPVSEQRLVVDPAVLSVVEGGTNTFTVRLAEAPEGLVTVYIRFTGGDTDLQLSDSPEIRFGPDNWSTPVVVPVLAWPDADQENGSATFVCEAAGLTPVSVVVFEEDTTVPPPNYVLTVSVNNASWGSVSSSGGTYPSNTVVEVTAVPATYFQFDEWTGGLTSSQNPVNITLLSDLSLSARFSEILTTNHPTPHWWLAEQGYTSDFESAVDVVGANGYALWESYVAGLEPEDANSQLRVVSVPALDPPRLTLFWETAPGRSYTVLSSTNGFESFEVVPGGAGLPDTIRELVVPIDPGAPAAAFRVEVSKP